jgi:hypothetical protein
MIMVFYGWPKVAKTKTPQAFGDLRRFWFVKVLSQPQVRTQAKPIKEILAAGCVVYLRTVHEAKIAEPSVPSSRTVRAKVAAEVTRRIWR